MSGERYRLIRASSLQHQGTIQPQKANNMTPTCKIEHHNNKGPRILLF